MPTSERAWYWVWMRRASIKTQEATKRGERIRDCAASWRCWAMESVIRRRAWRRSGLVVRTSVVRGGSALPELEDGLEDGEDGILANSLSVNLEEMFSIQNIQ